MRVLIVEPDADVLDIVTELLRFDGFEVVGCGEPAAALALLDELSPDAIVLDPAEGGLTAGQFRARQRRTRCAGVPLVLVTTLTPNEVRSAEPARVLPKPFSVAEMSAALRTLMPAAPHPHP